MFLLKTVYQADAKTPKDIRRLRVDPTSKECFSDVINFLSSIYGSDKSFHLKYLDDDQDLCTVDSMIELSEAIRLAKEYRSTLKLFVSFQEKDVVAASSAGELPGQDDRQAAAAQQEKRDNTPGMMPDQDDRKGQEDPDASCINQQVAQAPALKEPVFEANPLTDESSPALTVSGSELQGQEDRPAGLPCASQNSDHDDAKTQLQAAREDASVFKQVLSEPAVDRSTMHTHGSAAAAAPVPLSPLQPVQGAITDLPAQQQEQESVSFEPEPVSVSDSDEDFVYVASMREHEDEDEDEKAKALAQHPGGNCRQPWPASAVESSSVDIADPVDYPVHETGVAAQAQAQEQDQSSLELELPSEPSYLPSQSQPISPASASAQASLAQPEQPQQPTVADSVDGGSSSSSSSVEAVDAVEQVAAALSEEEQAAPVSAPVPVPEPESESEALPVSVTPVLVSVPDAHAAEKEEAALEPAEEKSERVPEQKEQKQKLALHLGIQCDGCGAFPVEGNRYKCVVCPDYDLCERCEVADVHPRSHVMMKMKVPHRFPLSPKGFSLQSVFGPRAVATFVDDVTYPDRAVVHYKPDSVLMKTWRVKNTGAIPWPKGSQLVYERGALRPATKLPIHVTAVPGATAEISVPIAIPKPRGRQLKGVYKLVDDQGYKFMNLWIQVSIEHPPEQPASKTVSESESEFKQRTPAAKAAALQGKKQEKQRLKKEKKQAKKAKHQQQQQQPQPQGWAAGNAKPVKAVKAAAKARAKQGQLELKIAKKEARHQVLQKKLTEAQQRSGKLTSKLTKLSAMKAKDKTVLKKTKALSKQLNALNARSKKLSQKSDKLTAAIVQHKRKHDQIQQQQQQAPVQPVSPQGQADPRALKSASVYPKLTKPSNAPVTASKPRLPAEPCTRAVPAPVSVAQVLGAVTPGARGAVAVSIPVTSQPLPAAVNPVAPIAISPVKPVDAPVPPVVAPAVVAAVAAPAEHKKPAPEQKKPAPVQPAPAPAPELSFPVEARQLQAMGFEYELALLDALLQLKKGDLIATITLLVKQSQ